MKLLSEYREGDRNARVFFDSGVYRVLRNNGTNTTHTTEFQAECAAEDWVLGVVDSGEIHAVARKG